MASNKKKALEAYTKKFTITFRVDPDTLSEDATEDNLEGFFALLENLLLDGLQHAEPQADVTKIRIMMEDAGGAVVRSHE